MPRIFLILTCPFGVWHVVFHKLLFTILLLFGNNLMTSILHIRLRKSESWLFYSKASSPVASQPSLLHIKLVGVDHLNLMTASFRLFTLLPDPVDCAQAIPPPLVDFPVT